ncbi:hypothetical protein TRVA0_006S02982 [Trichomonascus vanleenenianus]|uniref:uncharacterized protein n=1 Tax=Trichomonascus vanleenenianus TaxID=2268995 RepID=UPI003ECA28CC
MKSTGLSEEEKLRRRRERFGGTPKKVDDSYGLLSRGEDTRLAKDRRERRDYFVKVQLSYLKFTSKHGGHEEALKIVDAVSRARWRNEKQRHEIREEPIDNIYMSMRKLREASIANESDDLAVSIFLFSTKIAVIGGKYESYLPSMTYLLHPLMSVLEKRQDELKLIAKLYVLHLAHFNRALNAAFEWYFRLIPSDRATFSILRAFCAGNFVRWRKLYKLQDDMTKAILRHGEKTLLRETSTKLARSYAMLRVETVEQFTGTSLANLNATAGLQWKASPESNKIHFRTR